MKMTNEPSKLFSFSKSLLANKNSHSNIEQAAAFFILNRTSFSGLTMSGGFSKASYDGRFKKPHIEKCGSLKNVKKQIQIKEASYEELLFNQQRTKHGSFLILHMISNHPIFMERMVMDTKGLITKN